MDVTEKTKEQNGHARKNGDKQGLKRMNTSGFTRKMKKKKKTTIAIKVVEKLMIRAMTMKIQLTVIIGKTMAMSVMTR